MASNRQILGSRVVLIFSALISSGAVALGGCTSTDPNASSAADDADALRGALVTYVASFDDGTTEQQHFLRTGGEDGPEQRLRFHTDADLPPSGTAIRIWGLEQDGQIDVERFSVDQAATAKLSQPLVSGMKYGDRNLAFVRVDIGGGVPDLTAEEANRRVFGTNPGDNSVKQYYLEVSYGRQDIKGQVFGPFNHSMPGCDTRGLANTLRAQIPGTFQHYLWYMGTRASSCGWSGLAQSGSPTMPARDTWYNGSEGCVVLVQEPGHNFGMMHSSALRCNGAPFADDPNSCQHDEYGDRYDPMGSGCRHMNVWQKAYQGWFGGCNSVRVGKSGTFTLLPTEIACDGVQALQIPMPKQRPFARPAGGGGSGGNTIPMRFYYLELRTKVGFDAQMMNAPTVLVHVADEYRTLQQGGRHTWILDMNPGTMTLDGLGAGQSYTDPSGGVSFSVESVSASSATIQVTMPTPTPQSFPAENTCIGGGTLMGSGPASCGQGAGGGSNTGGSGGMGAGGSSAGGSGGASMGGRGGGTSGGASGAGGASSAGASGSAGNAGAASAGAPPVAGAGGATGVAGAFTVAGSPPISSGGVGGAPTAFAGMAGAIAVAGAPPVIDDIDQGGCACRVPSGPAQRQPGALALAAVALVAAFRRRRAR